MVLGLVLIKIKPHYEHTIYKKLAEIPQIVEYHPLFGEYDFIVKIETNTLENLEDIVLNSIRNIQGIISTKTLTGPTFH